VSHYRLHILALMLALICIMYLPIHYLIYILQFSSVISQSVRQSGYSRLTFYWKELRSCNMAQDLCLQIKLWKIQLNFCQFFVFCFAGIVAGNVKLKGSEVYKLKALREKILRATHKCFTLKSFLTFKMNRYRVGSWRMVF
jgi:hypothetical protein